MFKRNIMKTKSNSNILFESTSNSFESFDHSEKMETELEIAMICLNNNVSISNGCEFETEQPVIGHVKEEEFEFNFDCSSLPESIMSSDVVFFNWRMMCWKFMKKK